MEIFGRQKRAVVGPKYFCGASVLFCRSSETTCLPATGSTMCQVINIYFKLVLAFGLCFWTFGLGRARKWPLQPHCEQSCMRASGSPGQGLCKLVRGENIWKIGIFCRYQRPGGSADTAIMEWAIPVWQLSPAFSSILFPLFLTLLLPVRDLWTTERSDRGITASSWGAKHARKKAMCRCHRFLIVYDYTVIASMCLPFVEKWHFARIFVVSTKWIKYINFDDAAIHQATMTREQATKTK